MIPHNEVHNGNWVQISVDGQQMTGKVARKSVEMIGVATEAELGWYYPEDLNPILLTEDWLGYFHLEKFDDPQVDGTGLAYKKGLFHLFYPDKNDKSHVIMTCHGSHDVELHHELSVNEFQNKYHMMTKVFVE
ncbi:MAG: hypothetical protein EPN39_01895 [Chitinophagaceae bacterium]|nr:MAG: hypothetical protein EPN39_01895 [Chitinophagaceae bacterium]